jgi:hypothetical protein
MSATVTARKRPADNPFASHRVERLVYRADGVSLVGLCERLEVIGGRGAIVGPKGSGKTTLLEELASVLPGEKVVVKLDGSCPRPLQQTRHQLPTPVTGRHTVFIDGGERLGVVAWRRLLRATHAAAHLVATQHRPGRLPTLVECLPDLELFRELVSELVPADAMTLRPQLEKVYAHHNGNVRLCLRELYDVYAGRSTHQF